MSRRSIATCTAASAGCQTSVFWRICACSMRCISGSRSAFRLCRDRMQAKSERSPIFSPRSPAPSVRAFCRITTCPAPNTNRSTCAIRLPPSIRRSPPRRRRRLRATSLPPAASASCADRVDPAYSPAPSVSRRILAFPNESTKMLCPRFAFLAPERGLFAAIYASKTDRVSRIVRHNSGLSVVFFLCLKIKLKMPKLLDNPKFACYNCNTR